MTSTYRIGQYNAEFGHPKAAHATMIWWRFQHLQLDALCVEEAGDYVAELVKQCPKGAQVIHRHPRRGADQQIVLVREGVKVNGVYSFKAGLPYGTIRGGTMFPESPLMVRLDNRLTLVARHAAVAAWVAGKGGRHWVGAIGRRLAYAASQRRLLTMFKNHLGKPVLVMGDWNATPATRGLYSPDWLRLKVGGVWVRPHRNTGHGEIDFGIGTHITVHECKVDPNPGGMPHSDHDLVWATISVA